MAEEIEKEVLLELEEGLPVKKTAEKADNLAGQNVPSGTIGKSADPKYDKSIKKQEDRKVLILLSSIGAIGILIFAYVYKRSRTGKRS